MISPGSFQRTRTKAGVPVMASACSIIAIWSYPIRPCWASMQTQSNPERPMSSAEKGLGTTHHPPSLMASRSHTSRNVVIVSSSPR